MDEDEVVSFGKLVAGEAGFVQRLVSGALIPFRSFAIGECVQSAEDDAPLTRREGILGADLWRRIAAGAGEPRGWRA